MRVIPLYGGGTATINEMPEDMNAFVNAIDPGRMEFKRGRAYYAAPCAFDIESTSTYVDGKKAAFMYVWQLSFNDMYIIGRTWTDFLNLYDAIIDRLQLTSGKRLIVYIHNMTFEYQFMRKLFKWQEVFSREERKPLKACTVDGIEFRDSYALTNKSLEAVGEDLRNPVKKAVGDLDYNLVRTSETPLTDGELGYCINDVRIVTELIRVKIEDDGGITKIPLTLTGYVREYTRAWCLPPKRGGKKKRAGYYSRIHEMNITGPDEYKMLKRAFSGGYTHASALNAGKVFFDVASFDITSSYPSIILAEKMPMSTGWAVKIRNEKQFERCLKTYACVFDVALYGLRPKTISSENYISASKCFFR